MRASFVSSCLVCNIFLVLKLGKNSRTANSSHPNGTPTRRGWHIGPKKVFGMQLLTVRYDHILSADLSRGLRICSDAVERDLWTIELIEISLFTF